MFEEFKLNTITKAEFLSGIEDKADKDEIANIVSSSTWMVHESLTMMNPRIHEPFRGPDRITGSARTKKSR